MKSRILAPDKLSCFKIAAACLTALMCASACTSLPTSSSPEAFDVDAPNASPIELSAGGPIADADPETLLNSFLLACAAGASDDYATARLFLTSSSAQTWDPHKLVTIYSTDSTPKVAYSFDPSKADTLNASITAVGVGSVDQNGVLSPAETSSLEARFHLVHENGQWRIDAPADGVVVSQASFTASHELVSLMFPSATGDALIADPRWYPTRRLETHMVEGLIAGPQSHLGDALVNAIPSGTSISSGGIELSDHVAKVSLNGSLPADERAKRLLAWEISQTLQRSGRVNSVEIAMGGETLETNDLPTQPSYDLDTAVAFSSEGLVRLDGRTTSLRSLPVAPSSSASLPAVSPVSSSLVAWREGDRMMILLFLRCARLMDRWGIIRLLLIASVGCGMSPRMGERVRLDLRGKALQSYHRINRSMMLLRFVFLPTGRVRCFCAHRVALRARGLLELCAEAMVSRPGLRILSPSLVCRRGLTIFLGLGARPWLRCAKVVHEALATRLMRYPW